MSYILHQKVGNHVYLYEAVSYRNAEGKPRSRRVPIGKLDEAGQPVYSRVWFNTPSNLRFALCSGSNS
jgi:hypothetical protein